MSSNSSCAREFGANRGDTALPKVTAIRCAGCRRSVADQSALSNRLSTLVLEWRFSPDILQRITSALPDVRVVTSIGADLTAVLPEADALVSWSLDDEQLAMAPR